MLKTQQGDEDLCDPKGLISLPSGEKNNEHIGNLLSIVEGDKTGEETERQGRGDSEWWKRGVEIFNCVVMEEKGSLGRCYLGKYLKAVKDVNQRTL